MLCRTFSSWLGKLFCLPDEAVIGVWRGSSRPEWQRLSGGAVAADHDAATFTPVYHQLIIRILSGQFSLARDGSPGSHHHRAVP